MVRQRPARKTTRPTSWLDAIRGAESGVVGPARVVDDRPVSSGETSFRGPGHRITAEVDVEQTLFGTPPESPLRIEGDTQRPPERRMDLAEARFPPDSLRQLPYWDYARPGEAQPVLVLTTDPPLVRPLSGPDDELVQAIQLVRRWVELPDGERHDAVMADLSSSATHPVAYVAGFQLVAESGTDLTGLLEEFRHLSGRPAEAVAGIVHELRLRPGGGTDNETRGIIEALLRAWSEEADPAAVSAYLSWFDAESAGWLDDPSLREAVIAQAARSQNLTSDSGWDDEVHYKASTLLETAEAVGTE